MRVMMRAVPLAVLLVALFILGSMFSVPRGHSLGSTTWTGAFGDGKWETAGNWNHGVPIFGVVADIPAGAFVVTISTAQIATTLSVGLGDTVTCESTCTLATESLTNLGTFTNYGTVTLVGFDNVGTFTNFGTVTIGTFVNDGTFTNRCHGIVNMTPTGPGTFATDPTCPPSGPVGGFMMPVNKLAVFAPYLALFGVMAVVVVAVAPWKKREN